MTLLDDLKKEYGPHQRWRRKRTDSWRLVIPLDWLEAAAADSNAALRAGLVLWLLAGKRQRLKGRPNPNWRTEIPCPSRPHSPLGGARNTFRDGLHRLEALGLIRRTMRGTKTALVTLLDAPEARR